MANGFANETARDGGDDMIHRRRSARPFAWSARRGGTSETGETSVVVLITQRSRVQIPPPLPGKTAPEALLPGPFSATCDQALVTSPPAIAGWFYPRGSTGSRRSCRPCRTVKTGTHARCRDLAAALSAQGPAMSARAAEPD